MTPLQPLSLSVAWAQEGRAAAHPVHAGQQSLLLGNLFSRQELTIQ